MRDFMLGHMIRAHFPVRCWGLGIVLAAGILLGPAHSAAAAQGAALDHGLTDVSPLYVLPFLGLLLSIALFPLCAPHFWHRYFGKIAATWAVLFLFPFALNFGWGIAGRELTHVMIAEYIPFILLLFALYTITGGIHISSALSGSPASNVGLLTVGTIIASWTGTTGAAMLFIHPFLRANSWRRHRRHLVVFFIFLVANIGGSLTPLGDPPLFLGFLKGVPFFWPLRNMITPMILVSAILLPVFYILDCYFYRREPDKAPPPTAPSPGSAFIVGKINICLLVAVVVAVLISGSWHPGIVYTLWGTAIYGNTLLRDLLLLATALLSLWLTPKGCRSLNEFSWFPIVEVAKLFAAIFITIIPAIAILRLGMNGAGADLVAMTQTSTGDPINAMFFWVTGILSSFLDNAPTYLIFFNLAGGDVGRLTSELNQTLLAISVGAVFMGANTYIGNAPNFMVRSIAEARGVRMPSFFGYMLWSLVFLFPLYILITFLFFR